MSSQLQQPTVPEPINLAVRDLANQIQRIHSKLMNHLPEESSPLPQDYPMPVGKVDQIKEILNISRNILSEIETEIDKL